MAPGEPRDPLVLRDRAGCMWLLGVGFLAGGCTVTVLLLGAGVGPRLRGWGLAAAGLIAIAHMVTGVWLVVRSPNVAVRLSRQQPTLHVCKRWPFLLRERVIHLDEMSHLEVALKKDTDGDPVYQLELELRSGERLQLHSVAFHARSGIDEAVTQLQNWSRGRLLVRGE